MITREQLDAIARELYPEQADWDALTAADEQRVLRLIDLRNRICGCGGNCVCAKDDWRDEH